MQNPFVFTSMSEAQEIERQLQSDGWFTVSVSDRALYPARLAHFLGDQAPAMLYCWGNYALLENASVSIIGTRRPGGIGKAAASRYAEALSARGFTIISGNAPGIDSVAHETALDSGGTTILCPPAPPDQFTPSFSAALDPARVLVVSRFAPGSSITKWYFLGRNELVAAHAGAAIIAETGTRGGTLNTLDHLRRMQRSVFIVDLPSSDSRYRAHQAIIASGATPVSPVPSDADLEAIITAAKKPLPQHRHTNDDLFESAAG